MPLNYLALGDSYTIGEGVSQEHSFPYRLVQKLRDDGSEINDPHIIAKTGWTTDELIRAIKDEGIKDKFDLVTLLIGVNNQYRGYSTENYNVEFLDLLQTALSYSDFNKNNVIVISIPDWSITPFAKQANRDPKKISKQIEDFNAINKDEALQAGIPYIDIATEFNRAASDPSMLADDGLHPSGKMYADWVEKIAASIRAYH
ncbi:MAG TPA: SGNH/GDSL hydrolase family protein [Daejeonella sp.]|nr:SGNH/GDSL hydrolase family protein [Daejeonella sp.]